ncbi:MAG: RNA polymerase sigma factor, partial [Actinomycetota bacterium]|nr:RNA polymerase sigma factor [Actinomycetota bacterium]
MLVEEGLTVVTARRLESFGQQSNARWDDLDERELSLAFNRGEDGAYQAIYDRYAPRVHGVCRRMLGNPQDAQEASQETFLKVYQALPRFNGRYQLGAWVTRIATNVCLDHIRSRSRKPVESELFDLSESELEATPEGDPEQAYLRGVETRRVRRVLAKLPPMHRAAIVLRDFEGLSYAEVAAALGVTECQVKALIHRARQGFKRSWTSAFAGLLWPIRSVDRVRRIDLPVGEDTVHALSGATRAVDVFNVTAQAATTCSVTLQQCGQYLAERVAPVVAAVV